MFRPVKKDEPGYGMKYCNPEPHVAVEGRTTRVVYNFVD